MNESIKDKFLKEHALNDDELDKVSGGRNPTSNSIGWGICHNPLCDYCNAAVPVYPDYSDYCCVYCNDSNVTNFDF